MRKQTLIILSFLIFFSCFVYGQDRKNTYESKIGYGYYQGFNTGLSYFYTEKLKFGLGAGSHLGLSPLKDEKHINIQIENTLYFGKLTKQNIGRWYFNQQLMYWEQGEKIFRWKILSLGLNIGRTIPITEKLGLDLEIGPAFNKAVDIEREPYSDRTGWMWPVLYNGRLQLAYKIK